MAFIRDSGRAVGKREIARAFKLKGGAKIALKKILRELKDGGEVQPGRSRRVAPYDVLPQTLVIEIAGIDEDGELLGRPATWEHDQAPPRIVVGPDRAGTPALKPGDRVLARLNRAADGVFEVRPIRRVAGAPETFIGVYSLADGKGRIRSTDRRHRSEFSVAPADAGGAKPGDLVRAATKHGRHFGLPGARVLGRLGPLDDPRSISLIAIHTHDLPHEFGADALREAAGARPVTLGERSDLRDLPLVTIDGADARDFDDAVWAEPDSNAGNPGGFHLIVAIADVAHYVRPGDALDKAAYERGNSVYFPDRVVPMLPEQLSNNLCSLRPGEDRACLAAHLWIDGEGRLKRHRFERTLMRSGARLTYEQVQSAKDGFPDNTTRDLVTPVIAPLYAAYESLAAAKRARGALDLDLPERQAVLGRDGRVAEIRLLTRLDSHRLIEEFMIAANVAAAEALEAQRWPCVYRIHDTPDPEKVAALADILESIGLHLARGHAIRPKQFAHILARVEGTPNARLVSELMLRAQAQAVYAPENIGHFGLALRRYCHFTSPIRRYADLLVHRALIAAYRLGDGGLVPEAGDKFESWAAHVSRTERRAQAAERSALDRFVTVFLSDRVGAEFSGRVNGVTRFGLFVELDETGADGLVPVRTLGGEYFDHDESRHALIGQRTGRSFVLGDIVRVVLKDADPVTGGITFELIEGGRDQPPPGGRSRPGGPAPRRRAKPASAKRQDRRNGGHGKARKHKKRH